MGVLPMADEQGSDACGRTPAAGSAYGALHAAVVVVPLLAFLAIVLALTLTGTHGGTLQSENRTARPWPSIGGPWAGTIDTRNFFLRLEAAFADRLALRLFGVSPTYVVVIGRDGSLFYAADDIIQTRRKPRRGPAEAAAVARRTADGIARRWSFLRERGIRYVLLIAPDRASVYRDQLPAQLARGPAHLDLVLEALPAEVRPDVIDLRRELLRQRAVEEVYYRTDTHWNVAGARVALRKLVRTLGEPPEAEPAFPDFPKVGDTCGLGRAIGLPSLFPEACYHDAASYPFEQHRDCSFAVLARDAGGRLQRIAAKCRGGTQRALVLRDSL